MKSSKRLKETSVNSELTVISMYVTGRSSRTFIEAALVWIQQRAHVSVYHLQRVREFCFGRVLGTAVVTIERGDVLAGTCAKVYDIAPVVRLLLHLFTQPASAEKAVSSVARFEKRRTWVCVKERCGGRDDLCGGVCAGAFGARDWMREEGRVAEMSGCERALESAMSRVGAARELQS